jgi:hypothetical protein
MLRRLVKYTSGVSVRVFPERGLQRGGSDPMKELMPW